MNDGTTLLFLDHLQARNYNSLGFLTRTSLAEYIARHQVDRELHNNTPCGHLLFYDGRNHHRPLETPNTLRIRQACIDYDVRLIEHGRALVRRLIEHANILGYSRITCWVGADLPANRFWTSLRFIPDQIRTQQGRKHPTHIHYTLHLERNPRDFQVPFQ